MVTRFHQQYVPDITMIDVSLPPTPSPPPPPQWIHYWTGFCTHSRVGFKYRNPCQYHTLQGMNEWTSSWPPNCHPSISMGPGAHTASQGVGLEWNVPLESKSVLESDLFCGEHPDYHKEKLSFKSLHLTIRTNFQIVLKDPASCRRPQLAVCSPSPLIFSGTSYPGWKMWPTPSGWCLMLCFISTNSLPFCPLSTGLVWCVGPPPSVRCLAASRYPPPRHAHTSTTSLSPQPHLSHLFSTFFLPLPLHLSLSTHLSLQRILHWSNECANSACCIKCGHPNKLHPLQGIGVIGSEAVIESPPRAPRCFTCSCQSPMLITTSVVEVLTCHAVSLQQQNLHLSP